MYNIANAQERISSTQEISSNVVFDKSEHDFGIVPESGGILECVFTVKNTNDIPLVITKVTTSCGCTASEWTNEPIAVGKQGFIKVTFNPKGYRGSFNKSLTVFTNSNPSRVNLKIKGQIEEPAIVSK